jgi:regulator of sigma E protease
MASGAIGAVQANSPAAKAGLKQGEKITEVDGKPVGNPLTLDDRLRQRVAAASGETDEPLSVDLTLEGRTEPVTVQLRPAGWYELPLYGTEHASVPSMGITIEATRRVAEVEEGSSAAMAGVKAGDVIKAFRPIPPTEAKRQELQIPDDLGQPDDRIDLVKDDVTWSAFFYFLQNLLPGTTVELELEDGRKVQLEWTEDDQWHHPERGLKFEPKETFVQAQSMGEAVRFGIEETQNSLMMVFKFISKIGSQVSLRGVGGPITIVKIAYHYATSRFTDLLLFLCVISANLAVINFLPIPVLDGGHMVFLAYEGVRGKPPSENVQIGMSYVGLLFLLTLMVWVFGLDLGFISR